MGIEKLALLVGSVPRPLPDLPDYQMPGIAKV